MFKLTTNSVAWNFVERSVGGIWDIGRDPGLEETILVSVTRHNVCGVRHDYFMHILFRFYLLHYILLQQLREEWWDPFFLLNTHYSIN